MTPEFEELIKNFKPEFGNQEHIRVLGMVDKLRKKEKLVKEKLTNQSAINRSLKEIEQIESQIVYLIK